MATSKETLKEYFDTGKKPTGQEFTELIDAFVHRGDDLQALLGRIAEINEAESGEGNSKYMTPFLTLKAIVALVRLANVPGLKDEVVTLDAEVREAMTTLMTSKDEEVKTDLTTLMTSKDDAVKTDLTTLMTSKDDAVKTDLQEKINTAINTLIGGASGAYDTLIEIQNELQDNDSQLASLLSAINNRYSKTEVDGFLLHKSNNSHTHTPSQVGLGNLPNSKSDSTSYHSSYTLATSKAIYDAREYARNWNNQTNRPSGGTGDIQSVRAVFTGNISTVYNNSLAMNTYRIEFLRNGTWTNPIPNGRSLLIKTY